MNGKSIGLIEMTSVVAGFAAADAMLKAGDVRLLLSRSICSGKYMVLIGGEPAAVESALEAGVLAGRGCVIDRTLIANLHPDVLAAIGRGTVPEPAGALGLVESFQVATMVAATDAAVKAADVRIHELRLAMALGGKAFVALSGDVAAVQAGVAAARRVVEEAGALVNAVVLARPHPDVYREIV